MKPFDLEEFKAGRLAITRSGRTAKFIAHVPDCYEYCRLVVLIEGSDECTSFGEAGNYYAPPSKSPCDLVGMAPIRKVGYMTLFDDKAKGGKIIKECSNIYPTMEDCANICGQLGTGQIIKVEWDE